MSGKAKGILAVVLILVAGSIVIFREGDASSAGDAPFACVSSGEIFYLDNKDVDRMPGKNPKTGQRTLFPCNERNGVFYVADHYRETIRSMTEQNHYVDPGTLEVRQVPKS